MDNATLTKHAEAILRAVYAGDPALQPLFEKALPDYLSDPAILAALRAAVKADADAFQDGVADWMLACFGPEITSDRLERGDRFIEEALELAQTVPGFTADRAHALVDYVFNRPVGEQYQEVGGVMVTLAALCNTFGLSIAQEADRELARVWTKVEAIRAKQAAKPTGSALPAAFDIRQNPAFAAGVKAGLEAAAQSAELHGRTVSNEPIGKACAGNIADRIRKINPTTISATVGGGV